MSFINIIPSSVVTQALASAGADAVVIDQEHAPVGPESLHAMIASTAGTKCLPFVRVTKRAEAMVKLAVCTENLIRVDDVMESPKLAE
jgi:4-hydroxy-2-oxoheptanedioate aldolase